LKTKTYPNNIFLNNTRFSGGEAFGGTQYHTTYSKINVPLCFPSIKKDDEMLDKNFASIRNDTVKLCFRGFEKPFFGGAVCLTSKT